MCVPQAGMLIGQGGLLESLGDPLGTKKSRDEAQQTKWAREDAIRDATFAHEEKLAGMNRTSMNVPKPGTGVVGGQGGSKSRYNSGGSQSGTANKAS